jgi:hypothetical protein
MRMTMSLLVLIVVVVLIGLVLGSVFVWKRSTIAGISLTTIAVVLVILAVGGYILIKSLSFGP